MASRVIAVIPARYASTRFPGKPLALIAGVPMVLRVLRNVSDARSVDRVIVATDDDRIASAVKDAGGEVAMTAPELASGSDRVWAAIANEPGEVIVNVQGDEPLLPGAVVDALVDKLAQSTEFDIATPVVEVPRLTAGSSDVVTVARDATGAALYFSRAIVPSGPGPVWRHIGVYAFRRAALERYVSGDPTDLERRERLEQLRALSLGLRIAAVDVDVIPHAVDRREDVAVVERALGAAPETDCLLSTTRLVVLDVDGVLTRGDISYLPDGSQLMSFDVKDGQGITALRGAGFKVALLSGRDSRALQKRARELGITDVRTGVTDKAAALAELAHALEVPLNAVCYVGDDDPDVAAMAISGVSAAPADASASARATATRVLLSPGGRGAVRELADELLTELARHEREV